VQTSLVAAILRVCNSSTIDFDGSPSNAVRAITAICLRFIDKRKLMEVRRYAPLLAPVRAAESIFLESPPQAVLPGVFVDWNFVEENAGCYSGGGVAMMASSVGGAASASSSSSSGAWNLFGDSRTWIGLLEHVSFPDTSLPESTLRRLYPPIWCILNSVRESKAYESCSSSSQKQQQQQDGGATTTATTTVDCLTFSDVCKLCIAINLEGVSGRNMADQYIAGRLKRKAYNLSSNLMSALADERHEAGVYLSTMEFILKNMIVDEKTLHANVAHYRETR
jgi:hypothetical protein